MMIREEIYDKICKVQIYTKKPMEATDEILKLFEKLIDEKINRIKDERSSNYYYGVMFDVLENLKEELEK